MNECNFCFDQSLTANTRDMCATNNHKGELIDHAVGILDGLVYKVVSLYDKCVNPRCTSTTTVLRRSKGARCGNERPVN